MTKSELRKIYLERRNKLSRKHISDKSQRIAERFFARFDLTPVRNLHLFIPIAKFNEIDTSHIYKKIWKDFRLINTISPRIDNEPGHMTHLVFSSNSELIENKWWITEPASCLSIDEAEIDMVLVPLLCFDEHGHRVGYGKGYYDRFLAKRRPDCVSVGLSYFPPVDRIDDVSSYDVCLDFCITPDETFAF